MNFNHLVIRFSQENKHPLILYDYFLIKNNMKFLSRWCKNKNLQTLILFFMSITLANAQVTGTVFRDFNANGTKDTNEPLVSGILVKAYNTSGALCASATTAGATAPNYTLPTTCTGQVRVEFEIPTTNTDPVGPLASIDYASYGGATYGSSVQFASAGATNINFAINAPNDYCEANPQIALSCYENGSGVGNTNAAFITFPYNSSGSTPAPSKNFDAQTLGSVYGIAFQNTKKLVYTAAFLKRHSGLGVRGMDGVYVMDYSTSTPTLVGGFDLQGITPANGGAAIDLGTVTRTNITTTISAGAAGDNQLSSVRTNANRDLDAFVKAGAVGFGDIDVSEDNNFLWLVNLNQKALIKVDISSTLAATTNPNTLASAKVNQYMISGTGVPACVNGQLRPFGLEFKYGKGYVGVVCDASTSATIQRPADLKAYVLSFDPANPTTFIQELSVNLNHVREQAYISGADGISGNWQRWMDSNADYGTDVNLLAGLDFVSAPQPLLSDIDITEDGSMILSFQDRFTHQSGNMNLIPVSDSTALVRTIGAGDILYAKKNTGAGYTVEPTSTDGPPTYPGFLTNDGPNSDGEYFFNDYYVNTGNTSGEGHFEISLGASAYIQGKQEVAQISYDPAGFFTQGVRFYNVVNGAHSREYTVLNSNFGDPVGFGKGSALGDIEVLCSPPPIEIGNRIWKDTNKDGIQNAGEEGIDGVEIELYEGTASTGTAVQTVTSATLAGQKGSWYFTNLKANQDYVIKVKTALGAGALATCTAFSPTGAGTTLVDNNTSNGTITLKTGNAGENNHSFDIGVNEVPVCVKPNAGADLAQCLPKTSTNLTDATATTEWIAYSANPALATIDATTGVIAGMTVAGTYKFILRVKGSAACADTMQIVVSVGDPAFVLCDDGTTSYTLTADVGVTNVVWYNMAGVQVGTGSTLFVNSKTLGLEDGSEAFYYTALDTTGCTAESCCPIKFTTEQCCPVVPYCLPVGFKRN